MANPESTTGTKQRLLDIGMAMLLEHGYHGLGTQALLAAADVPKGSFYHHFADKESFALAVVDEYMRHVHAALDEALSDPSVPPLKRVRAFFELTTANYAADGYLGCLMGGLGQELSGTSDTFRVKIEGCLTAVSERLSVCIDEAQACGDISAESEPNALAAVLVDCWEGAALRSRLRGSPEPLTAMLDFYFGRATDQVS